MKRAAILLIAIATLVLIGYPSVPSLASTSNAINTAKSVSGPTVTSGPGGRTVTGGGDTGGGTDQGDADGLSGIKGRPPLSMQSETVGSVTRVMVILENWWKFMLWSR